MAENNWRHSSLGLMLCGIVVVSSVRIGAPQQQAKFIRGELMRNV